MINKIEAGRSLKTMFVQTSMGANGVTMDMNTGEVMSSAEHHSKSGCCADFDDYVKRVLDEPFPYNPMSPASRETTDLWSHRRLKIFQNDKWREGCVISWEQYNSGPFARETNWNLTIGMDTPKKGDCAQIDGLENAKHFNGKACQILAILQDQGRFKVEVFTDGDDPQGGRSSRKKKILAIKPSNLQEPVLKVKVNRMNIEGGGTVYETSLCNSPLLSLEWLEPASPCINLDEGGATCPTCRAVEISTFFHKEDNATLTETDQNCPVCLDSTQCRILECQHVVCVPCWRDWCRASSGLPKAAVMDSQELQRERTRRHEAYISMAPHTFGGTATELGDSEQIVKEAEERFNEYGGSILFELVELAENSGDEGLARFQQEVLLASPRMLWSDSCLTIFMKTLSLPALEILQQVLDDRKEETELLQILSHGHEGLKGDAAHHMAARGLCNRIGELYEEVRNYRRAIPWYQRSLGHGLHLQERLGSRYPKYISVGHCNLGLAQKYAGFLKLALENYDKSISNYDANHVRENRKTLLREMKEWTGSSGNLTPGC